MSPILFFTRVTGLALLTSVGGYLLIKKLAPRLRILQPQRSIFETAFKNSKEDSKQCFSAAALRKRISRKNANPEEYLLIERSLIKNADSRAAINIFEVSLHFELVLTIFD